jgi:hypothetical protein
MIALAMTATLVTPARAGAIDVQYSVSLAGLSLGTATLKGNVSRQGYQLNASASLTGLAGMVTGGRGAAVATGAIAGNRISPANYSVNAANSEMSRTIQMGLSGNTVNQVVVNPPLDAKPDRVAVTSAHKTGVIDPVGAIVMPTSGSPEEACNRKLPIFDGAQRFDVTLSYAGTRNASAQEGYSGPVVVCKARYTPIAGHRAGRKAVQYMADNRDMEAWLAPAAEGIYIPFRVSVKTQVGTTVLQATKFRVEGAETTGAVRR